MQLFLDSLPSAEQYEQSFMHRDVVTHVAVAKQSDFIITGSVDGHVKFWKKMLVNIEFVKHFQVSKSQLFSFISVKRRFPRPILVPSMR